MPSHSLVEGRWRNEMCLCVRWGWAGGEGGGRTLWHWSECRGIKMKGDMGISISQ